jgi:cobalamin biosynthesis protein CobT
MKATILKRLAKDAAITADVQTALTLALDAMEKEDCGEDDEMEAEDEDPDKKAEDEEAEEEEKKAKDKAAKDKAAKDKAAKDKAEDDAPKMTKASMDAAITAAVTKSRTEQRAEIMAEFNAIAAAKTEVMPLVGEVTAAMDSAIDVYKFALDHEGVSLDGTESLSALKTMVKMAADRSAPQVFIANDAKPGSAVTDMFPGLRRLRA